MRSENLWRPQEASSRQLIDLAGDQQESTQTIDPEAASRHGLLGLVAFQASRAGNVESARLLYARLLGRQSVMKVHLRRLLALLDQTSIPAVVLKGPDVANRYRHPEQRTFTDLDLLVPRDRLDDCIRLLQTDDAVLEIPPRRPRTEKRDVLIRDSQTGVSFALDLHWDLFSYFQLQAVAQRAIEEAWAGAEPIVDDLGPRWLLPEPAQLAFLCAHAVLDHRFRLILFRDLLEIARQPVDWLQLADFAERHGLRCTTYLAWLITARALQAAVPESILKELRPRGAALAAAEYLLARTDLVTFDGHRPHPLNLALVLVHDRWRNRVALAARAPMAFPSWRRRVTVEHSDPTPTRR